MSVSYTFEYARNKIKIGSLVACRPRDCECGMVFIVTSIEDMDVAILDNLGNIEHALQETLMCLFE